MIEKNNDYKTEFLLINLFKGRLCRTNFVLGILLFGIIETALLLPTYFMEESTIFKLIDIVISMVVIWTLTLSLLTRRLHDLGKHGSYSVFLFVPIMNVFVIYWILLFSGEKGTNKFGYEDKVGLKSIFGLHEKGN